MAPTRFSIRSCTKSPTLWLVLATATIQSGNGSALRSVRNRNGAVKLTCRRVAGEPFAAIAINDSTGITDRSVDMLGSAVGVARNEGGWFGGGFRPITINSRLEVPFQEVAVGTDRI